MRGSEQKQWQQSGFGAVVADAEATPKRSIQEMVRSTTQGCQPK